MAVFSVPSQNLNRRAIALALITLSFGVAMTWAQKAAPAPHSEHTFFTESEGFDHAAPPPPRVLEALLRRKEVKDALVGARNDQRENPSQLFEVAKVHLHTSDEVDLIVRGDQPVSGGDNTWFWVVILAESESPRVAPWCSAGSLEVMNTKTNGYKNISCDWSSASEDIHEQYRFNGQKYILWKKSDSSRP